MFDKDFFPTSKPVIQKMLEGCNFKTCTILEPSAGKGDILDYIVELERDRYSRGSKEIYTRLFAIEKHPELQSILRDKGYTILENDFLNFAPEQRFHLILMNPPFSAGAEHLLHAIHISDGAEIRCLLNAETLRNAYSKERALLLSKLKAMNAHVQSLGPCFQDAERSSNVEVMLVKIPAQVREKTFEFKGNVFGEKNYKIEDLANNQVSRTDVLETMVHRYNKLKEIGHKMYQLLGEAEFYAQGLGVDPRGAFLSSLENSYRDKEEAFAKYINQTRKEAWNSVYTQTKVAGLVTTQVRRDIEEGQKHQTMMAFTVENIEGLLGALLMNWDNIRTACITQAFDRLTAYHEDNKVHVEGWKHNDAWMVKPKIIVPFGMEYYRRNNKLNWEPDIASSSRSELLDIEKALCFVTGKRFENIKGNTIDHVSRFTKFGYGEWVSSEFFDFKLYKKGTLHLRFRDLEVCNKFNIEACRGKNWLPADYGKATV